MFKFLFGWLVRKPKACDHIYFPVMLGDQAVGQECALCHKYNSLADVMAAYKEK